MYFITICAHNRESLFGRIVEGQDSAEMRLNTYGEVVRDEWLKTPSLRPNVVLGEWVIMPNHIHGIIIITHISAGGVLPYAPTDADGAGTGVLPYAPTDADGAGTGVLPYAPMDADGAVTGVLPYAPTDADGAGTGVLPYAPTDADGAGRGVLPYAPTGFRSPSQTIGAIVRGFKSAVTKKINLHRSTPGVLVWQRNYWEHIVRNERSYFHIATYINNNPATWQTDKLYPAV
jgi:putative transposase